jgi:hypothetical protein
MSTRRAARTLGATIIAVIALGESAGFAGTDSAFFRGCSFAKGDAVAAVKAFYGIHVDPRKLPVPTPSGTAYEYRFGQFGVRVFFDAELRVNGIRLDPPFAGSVGGIVIGDSEDGVRRVKGEPPRRFQGVPDPGVLEKRQQRKAELVASLPDPAPIDETVRVLAQVARIDSEPMAFTTAWAYGAGTRDFVRYDFSSEDGKVEEILTNSCDAKD